MAASPIGPDSARENPHAAFLHASAVLEMARSDLGQSGDTDDEIDFYVDAQTEATEALLLTPAPDIAALAKKLEIFRAEECYMWIDEYREPMFDALLADAHRLAEEARP